MPEESRDSINRHLDRFQIDKRERMKYLLEELETTKEIPVPKFLSMIQVRYGIRSTTGEEYLDAWIHGGYITIQNDMIKFVKKPEVEKPTQTTSSSHVEGGENHGH